MLRADQLQLDLIINGDESRKKIVELKARAAELRKEMKGIKDQELLGKKADDLKKIDSEIEDLYQTIGVANMSMKELASRSKVLGSVLASLDPNTAEFKAYKKELDDVNARHKELSQNARTVGKDVKSSMSGFSLAGIVAGGMAAYNTAVAVFNGIKNGIMSSIEAYRAQEVAIQKVEQAIKQTGGSAGLSLKQLTDEATRLQDTTIFGDEQILNDATAQLLTFTNITGVNFLKAQRAAMDLSTVLDGDLQAASIQLGKALNDPVTGLTALRRVGISFTDDQRKMIKELTETNRLEEAQAIILQEVNRQYGGQAEAVAKGTGTLKQAGIQIGEIAESIGGIIGKIITPFAGLISQAAKSINGLLSPAMTAVESFEKQGRSVAVLVRDIDPLLDRYDQLKTRANLNATEQEELKKIIAQVAAVMPGAATAFDEYGNAIAISTGRVREYIKGQILLLRYENREAIDETISDIADLRGQLDQASATMNEIGKTGTFKVFEPQSRMGAKTGGSAADIRDANQEEILLAQRRYQDLVNTETALNARLAKLRGDALQQSLSAYEAEKAAAAATAKDIADIKTMSNEELKDLSEDGNETQKKVAKEEIKRRDDLKKKGDEYTRYMVKIANDLETARLQIMQDGRDKDLRTEELAFRRKIAEIKGNTDLENQLRKALETEYQQKKEAIVKKYNDQERETTAKLEKQKWEARIKGLAEGSLEWFNVSQEILSAQRELELSNINLTEQQRLEIEEKYRNLRQSLNKKPDDSKAFTDLDSRFQAEWEATKMYLERTGQMTIEKKREIAAQERDMALAAAEGNTEQQMLIWEQYYAKLGEINGEWLDVTLQALTTLLNAFSSFDSALTAYEQAQLQRDEESNNAKKETLKKRLDAGLISQQQYDTSVARMDQELAEKKKKIAHDEAVRQKAMSIVQAIINTALAITAAMDVPYVGMALAIVAGVLGAAQVALIAATPIPEAARGRYDVIGQESNKRYRNVPYEESYTGIPGTPLLVNETGDELVIDPQTTQKLVKDYPDVVNTIRRVYLNEVSAGDQSLPELSETAKEKISLSPATLRYLRQNEPGAIEAINKSAMAEPGSFGPVKIIPKFQEPAVLSSQSVRPEEYAAGVPSARATMGSSEINPLIMPTERDIIPGPSIVDSIRSTGPGEMLSEQRIVLPLPIIRRINLESVSNATKFDRYPAMSELMNTRVPVKDSETINEKQPVIFTDPELVKTIKDLQEIMKKPLGAEIVYDKLVKSLTAIQNIENDTTP